MNIFKRKFSEKQVETPVKEGEKASPMIDYNGSSGTEIYGGYLQTDYLQAMSGSEAQKNFDLMERSDYNVAMCINAMKAPIKSTPLEVRFDGESDIALAQKALCDHILNNTRTPINKIVGEMLTIISRGFYVGEKVFTNVTDEPIEYLDENGNAKTINSYTSVFDIAFRDQKTIEKWNVDKNGNLEEVIQEAYGDIGGRFTMKAKDICHIAIDFIGSEFEGKSPLRPTYGNFVRKNKYLKLILLGMEKYAVPFMTCTTPTSATAKDKKNISTALKMIASGIKTFIRMGEGYTLEAQNIDFDAQTIESSVDKEDMRMTRAFLASFLLLGQTESGSRAVSNDLGQFFTNSLEYVANLVEDAINIPLKEAQIATFGKQSSYAYVKFAGISDRFGQQTATMLATLTTAGIITPDMVLESSTRKRMGLPKIDEDTRVEEVEQEQKFSLTEKVQKRWLQNNK